MTITRRFALQGLAASCLASLTGGCRSVKGKTSDEAYVNIILHGLFFMRFVGNDLVLQTPKFEKHKLCVGANGFLIDVPADHTFHLTDYITKLKPGNVNSFDGFPQIPQFSEREVQVGDFSGNFRMQIVLPPPEAIIPLRSATLGDFWSNSNQGNVAKSVYKSCGGNDKNPFSLVTCLRYLKQDSFGSPPVANWLFYAEHKEIPGLSDVNAAMASVDSTNLFTKKAFDLSFTKELAPKKCPDIHPGYGVSPDDENALFEISTGQGCEAKKASDPANCVQFGINR